jgi:hypothetical protein
MPNLAAIEILEGTHGIPTRLMLAYSGQEPLSSILHDIPGGLCSTTRSKKLPETLPEVQFNSKYIFVYMQLLIVFDEIQKTLIVF